MCKIYNRIRCYLNSKKTKEIPDQKLKSKYHIKIKNKLKNIVLYYIINNYISF